MAVGLKEKSLGTLVLVVLIGIVIGSYCTVLVRALIPGHDNVVKNFFTTSVAFGVGDFGTGGMVNIGMDDPSRKVRMPDVKPLMVDLSALRFMIGFQFRLSLLSVVGMFLSLYFFRWYK